VVDLHSNPEPAHEIFNIGVKALIVHDDRILMLKRRDHQNWEVPGGRINQGEVASQTLKRELSEELPGATRIHIGPIVHAEQADFILPNGNHLMLLFFRVSALLAPSIAVSDEHLRARWVSLDTLPSLAQPSMLEAAFKVLLSHRQTPPTAL
jgi:ADP-ribose pyrophosphatase YjhB (NUDIX family)